MTKTFTASVAGWVTKVKKVQNAVVSTATSDLLADIEVVPGIARGGTPQRGTIPRDIGALARSLESSLQGSTALNQTGEESWILVAGQMEAGDVATFMWGGKDVPYARRIHYGWGTYPGTFWVDVAANKWQGYVTAAVLKARVALR